MIEDGTIIESEDYTGDQKAMGFKEIVLMQLQRVVLKKSQEMRAGFWVMTNNPNIASQKVRYVGDSRKELINSIDTLHDLLLAKFDDDMKEKSEEINEKIEEMPKEDKSKQILKEYRKMFQELCLFLDRKGWLASKEISD